MKENMNTWVDSMETLLRHWGLDAETTGITQRLVIICVIFILAFLVDWLCRRFIVRGIKKITARTRVKWDDVLFNDKVLNNFCHIIPPVIIYALLPLAFPSGSPLLVFLLRLAMIYIIAVCLRFVSVFLGVLFELTSHRKEFRNRPLKGVYQIVQVALFFVGTIIIISVLINKSPIHLFAGLGASAAILLLVFKDTIMGFVSGVQLSANDMLRPGDWITMPKYGADGTVVEVTLNTVKVRNWDNTITTIPPYALVSDSFQNWRGMSESDGRRVKRSLNIDMTSVRFCTHEMLRKYKEIVILKEYIEDTEKVIRAYNEKHALAEDNLINGRHQTNLGVFRAYWELYLKSLPQVNTDMTCMVRQLQPTEKGIPMEIYFFSRQKDWIPYEQVQADIFDHILAVLPEFGLRVFQEPSGSDFRQLGSPGGSGKFN